MHSKTMIMIMLFQTLVLSLGQTLPTEITSHDADNDNPAASMALSGFPSGFTTTLESHSAGSSEASNNASSVDEVSDDHHYVDNETAADNEATADNGSNDDDDDDDCKIPDDLREMNRTMGPLLSLPEPDPLNRTYSDTNLFKDAENIKRHLWKKNPDACPTSSSRLPNRRSADVEDRSACPWYYELDINTYRIPQVMSKVKCQCERCAGFGESYKCVEVPYPVRVFKRKSNQCVNGFYEYEQVIEQHAIACTCAQQ